MKGSGEMTSKRYVPVIVLLASVPFWWLAAANYPGGTIWNEASVGFSFIANYVSSLFQPQALNGMDNAARLFAFVAMLLYASSTGYMFWVISSTYPKSVISKTVQISGVGSMVYAFISVTTPMHDLLVIIAAIFLAIACIAVLALLFRYKGSHKLVLLGFLNLILLAVLTITTKGNVFVKLGPAVEWLLFLTGALWVVLLYFDATAPNNSSKRTPKPLRGSGAA